LLLGSPPNDLALSTKEQSMTEPRPGEPLDDAPEASDASASEGPLAGGAPPTSPGEGITADQAKLALRKVKDPELGLNIVDLGLVYEIVVDGNDIHVDMTLTSPGCPAGPQIMTDVERALQALPGVGEVELNLVWSPYWTPERIEPRVRAYMGL
jgi:metal-sulfur cluster biosynthetic enzyme